MTNSNLLSPRKCPVCLACKAKTLFRQVFSSFSEGGLMDGYNLSLCTHCGAGYADDIPPQSVFDRHYAEMSKYERSQGGGELSAVDTERYRQTADMIAPHLSLHDAVVDVGCATGGLLADFKRRGFTNLLGIDPSSACTAIGERLYGITIRNMTIGRLTEVTERFDAAILTGVFEHLCDVDASLNLVVRLLKPYGRLYIEVPDATRYDRHFSAPFQFFSMEHVNYFSPSSLSNLMARHGFSVVFTKRLIRHLSPQAIEPTIGGLFRLDSTNCSPASLGRDDETEPALGRYIQQSRVLEGKINSKIATLADAAKSLAVWGTGTHTLRLLETSRLPQARIVAFIDSNVHYQGKTLAGIPVVAPSAFTDANAEILISSQTAEQEIFQTITQTLRWPNVVHRLYAGQ